MAEKFVKPLKLFYFVSAEFVWFGPTHSSTVKDHLM